MNRQTKREEIFRKPQKQSKWSHNPLTVADILNASNILPTDEITIDKMEGWDEGDSAHDGYTHLVIIRERPYTDEEQAEFERMWEEKKAESKENRYTQYLRLREEFAPAN